ncbi:unnamed protein product [Ascophyllum nodosum]
MATRQEGPDGCPALQVAQKAAASKGLDTKESNTHGVGLFAVKDIKAGDFNDFDCFGTSVLYGTEKVHDTIVADDVPRYMVTYEVASICVGGEVSRPHAALFLVPLPCHFFWYMNSCGMVKRANNVERESTFTHERESRKRTDGGKWWRSNSTESPPLGSTELPA